GEASGGQKVGRPAAVCHAANSAVPANVREEAAGAARAAGARRSGIRHEGARGGAGSRYGEVPHVVTGGYSPPESGPAVGAVAAVAESEPAATVAPRPARTTHSRIACAARTTT